MNLIRVLGLVGLLSVISYAQVATHLTGRVTDTSGVVANATVTVVSTADKKKVYSTQTNGDGKYYLSGFPVGTYLVQASLRRGNQTTVSETKTVRILYEDTTVVDLQLVSIQAIRETVTVSTGESQTVEQVSKTVDVITQQEMRDRADFSLVESLRTIPGFRVAQSGGFGRDRKSTRLNSSHG